MKVLLIEDDGGIRDLIGIVLTRVGIEFDCAGDGAAGQLQLRSNKYAALVLDLMLPVVNGFELVRELRSFSPGMLDRTIIITAASESTLRDFDCDQVFALLRKPFDLDDLLSTVSRCVDGAGAFPRLSQRNLPA
jgi:DNA-binding response OmpR family regulator